MVAHLDALVLSFHFIGRCLKKFKKIFKNFASQRKDLHLNHHVKARKFYVSHLSVIFSAVFICIYYIYI